MWEFEMELVSCELKKRNKSRIKGILYISRFYKVKIWLLRCALRDVQFCEGLITHSNRSPHTRNHYCRPIGLCSVLFFVPEKIEKNYFLLQAFSSSPRFTFTCFLCPPLSQQIRRSVSTPLIFRAAFSHIWSI